MPKLSVLMPVYNASRFLSAAIESILNQTFIDFEFLIIDDGSTDDSIAIIESYRDPRVRLIRNAQNMGISATLNRGIELAKTAWIARMDSDDISYPQRLEKQVAFINKHPDGALFSCAARVVDEAGNPIRQDDFKSEHFYYNLFFSCWIFHPTIVFSKKAVQSVGGYTVPYAEDFELYWQLMRGYKHYHQEETLLDYRETTQSLHQVTHKKEYTAAQLQQLLRNVRSVTSESLQVPPSHLFCMQHNYEPIEQENSLQSIASCIRTLDLISSGILAQPNPNLVAENVREAAAIKRKLILEHFMRSLPAFKSASLLALLGEWTYLADRVSSNLRRGKGGQEKSSPEAA